jgi:hypothetical protein
MSPSAGRIFSVIAMSCCASTAMMTCGCGPSGDPPPDPCSGVTCDDDGLFCNGVESCESGTCVSSGDPCGADETCDESTDACSVARACTTDADCDDALFCNGSETCVAGDCVAGMAPCPADETCDEENDACTTPDQNGMPFELVVVVSPDPARPGETLDVELTVTNTGGSDRTGVTLALEYPDHLDPLAGSLFDGSCTGASCNSPEQATFDVGTLAGGEGRTFSLPIQVASDTVDGTVISFDAVISDALASQVTGTASVAVNATRELELALVENLDPVPSGGMAVYTLTYGLLETSSGVLDGALSMPVPDGTTFVSATGGGVLNGNVVEWHLGPIGPEQVGEVQATMQVGSLIDGSVIEAEATLEDDMTPTNRVCYHTATRVQDDIPLALVVVTSSDPVRPGDTLDVELTVTNTGAFDRTGVVLTLEYPDHLDPLAGSLFDGSCTGASCNSQERATFDMGTLAGGEGRTFSLPIQVVDGVSDGLVITFEAEVSAANGDRMESGTSVSVSGSRQLELALLESLDPVATDGVLVYTMTYGLLEASGGVLDGVLSMAVPKGTSFASATGGGVLNGNVVEWSLGAIGPGQVGEVQATVQVESHTEGSVIEAEATLEDVLTPTNRVRSQAATRVQNDIPLALVVVTSSDPVRAGDTLDVELTVTNTGASDRSGVVLTLEYPDHLDALADSLFDGSCTGASCNSQEKATFDMGTLAGGEGRTFSLPLQVADGVSDGLVVTFEAEVSATNGDRMESGTSVSVSGSRQLELALVENLDPVATDGVLVYTMSYGLLETSSGVPDGVLSMPVPSGTSFVSATGGGVLDGDVVQWPLGAIGPGQVGEVQATVQVESPTEGSVIEAEATLEDVLTPTNHACSQASTRVQNDIPLALVAVASPDPVSPGEILDVELTVTNTGAFDRTGVVLTLEYPDHLDPLADSLFDGSCTGASCNSQERATFDIGTLAGGQQVLFHVRPTVAADALDGELIRFDAVVTDNTGLQVANTDVVKVGT